MADIVISVAAKVAECLVAPVGRQCGYVIFSDRKVRQLEHEVQKLDHATQRVQHSIDEAQNNMKLIEADVERWMKDAKTVANKVRDMLEYDRRAKKSCFCDWLPNPKVRYRLGMEASRTTEDLLALIAYGRFESVYYERPPPGIVGGDTITSSRASIFQEIMNALDDKKLRVIGIYGPGGVGKTTLLKEVQRKLRIENRSFDLIATMTVSQTPDLKKLQDDIAFALSLDLKNEPSEVRRRDLLFQKLQSDPTKEILIILDDLWRELDLKSVGIPLGEESRGCKLLLTSRFKDVLEQMLADRTFLLKGLEDEEAFRLIEKMVGDRLKSDEELKALAAQQVKKLAGLPLLIMSVASTLKFSGVSAWRNALIKINETKIETIVKLSYDHLKDEDAKYLFLLCGLIGGTIQVETLLGLCVGLGLFEGFNKTIQHSRDRLNAMLDSLRSFSLLQDGGDDKEKENVTIHDLYSEVVVSTPFRGQNSLMMNNDYGLWSKEKLEKCWAICLVNVGRDWLAELMLCGFPDLKILMLSQSQDWLKSPAHRYDVKDCCRLDFTCMKELRVLYLHSMHIGTIPSSIEILGNLRASYLDHCHVEDVAILGKLKALQILSFAGSTISRLPKEIGELMNLRILNLSNCKELHIIEPGVLKCLINLEELYMKGSFDRWMGNDEIPLESYNVSLAELKSLTKLTTLEISILNPTVLFEDVDFPFGNLIRFSINIGNVDRGEFEGLRNMKLKLGGCNSILSKEWVQKTLRNTQYLYLDGLREFEKNAHELCSQGFSQLEHLDIQNSPSIKYIASSSNHLLLTAFTILKFLFLENLINLEKICHGPIALECFSKLKVMHIKKCHLLKNLWFLPEMQRLVHLEEIQVHVCDLMQAIIIDDARKVEVAADDTIELPYVRHLNLCKLPNMMGFCIGAECAPIQVAFPRLETLEVTGLDNLGFIFLPSMVKYLAQLRELRVSDCINMGTIIMEEEGWGMEASETLALSMLTVLHLQRLERLTSFSRAKCSREARSQDDLNSIVLFNQEVAFPNLKTLEIFAMNNINMIWDNQVYFRRLKTLSVSSCDGLSHIFTPTIVGNLVELKKLTITSCKILTQVMVDEGGEEMHVVTFKQLKYLKLHMLARLKCFSSGGYTLVFPLLEDVMLVGCPNTEFFSERPIEVPKLDEVTRRDMWFWKENLNVISPNLLAMVAEEKKMRLSEIPMLIGKWHNQLNFIKSSWQLESLMVDKCPSFINAIPSRLMLVLDNMKTLQVDDCELLEEIFDLEGLEGMERTRVLPSLMTLDLVNLPKLRQLWNKDLQGMLCFNSLQGLTLYKCSNLRHAFTRSMARCLASLQWMEIKECSQMEGVIEEEEGQGSTVENITFSILDRIKLECLPILTSFLLGKNHTLECPRLVDLSIARCPKMRSLTWQFSMEIDNGTPSLFTPQVVFPSLEELHITDIGCIKMIWDNHAALSFPRHFQHLKTLDVSHCIGLSNIFTPTMAGNLVELTKLRISNCEMLTKIISDEGCKEGPIVAFKQLKYIELEELIGLTCFSSGRYTLSFPLLEVVIVTRCLNMKFFSEASLRAPKLNQVQVSTRMWFWNRNIRYNMQDMFRDMGMVDGVEFMHLRRFSKLTEKWHKKLIPIESSWQPKSLVVDDIASFLNAIPSKLMLVLDKINTLQVQNCYLLEEIFDLEGLEVMESTQVLPQLWCLNLINLSKLRRLWNKDLQGTLRFNSLSYLSLYNCSNLRYAFTPSMTRCLPTLQWMEIKECGQMEGVIEEEEGKGTDVEKITFPILRGIELERLPNLTGFPLSEKYMLECPMLRELTIAHCPKIMTFNWQSLMKIDRGISSPFTPQILLPRVKLMVLSHMDNSSKRWVDGSQHLRKVEAFEKLRVEFCVIEETHLSTIT